MNFSNFGNCISVNRKRKFTLGEKKSQARIANPNKKELYCVEVDNCLKFEGKKCDWLLIVSKYPSAIFIELKGSDIVHAFKQLINSMRQIESPQNQYLSRTFNDKKCYVITCRSPRTTTQIQKEAIRFRKLGAKLLVKSSPHEIRI